MRCSCCRWNTTGSVCGCRRCCQSCCPPTSSGQLSGGRLDASFRSAQAPGPRRRSPASGRARPLPGESPTRSGWRAGERRRRRSPPPCPGTPAGRIPARRPLSPGRTVVDLALPIPSPDRNRLRIGREFTSGDPYCRVIHRRHPLPDSLARRGSIGACTGTLSRHTSMRNLMLITLLLMRRTPESSLPRRSHMTADGAPA